MHRSPAPSLGRNYMTCALCESQRQLPGWEGVKLHRLGERAGKLSAIKIGASRLNYHLRLEFCDLRHIRDDGALRRMPPGPQFSERTS